MKFVDFLNESRKKELSRTEVIELIKNNCKNMDLNYPYVRGMDNNTDFYVIEGKQGTRKSATGNNITMSIIDNFLMEKFKDKAQLRKNSTIFSSHTNESHTENFGEPYYILPFDDSVLNYVKGYSDFNDIDLKHGVGVYKISTDLKDAINGPTNTYDKLINGLANILNKDEDDYNKDDKIVMSYFDKKLSAEDNIERSYGDAMKHIHYGYTKDIDNSNINAEVWTGDKVIAIRKDLYDDIKKEIDDKS